MSQDTISRMKNIVKERQISKNNLIRALNLIINNRSDSRLSRKHTHEKIKPEDMESYLREQEKFLNIETKLIELAASGVAIQDQKERLDKKNRNGTIQDICVELEQVFMLVISKPTKALRSRLNSPTLTPEKRNAVFELLIRLCRVPQITLVRVANRLIKALLESIDDAVSHRRIRKGLIRVVMYIGDCHRYLLRYNMSANAAELMRILNPMDQEAHMRLGINLSLSSPERDLLRPFFHFCVFLANRRVPFDHLEADVVRRIVTGCSRRISHSRMDVETDANEIKRSFPDRLIDSVWTLLAGDENAAHEKLKSKAFWNGLKAFAEDKACSTELTFVCGVLIFSHYRISPPSDRSGGIPPRRELSDFLLCKAISILAEILGKDLESFTIFLRNRKKNRRRALQKKRKSDTFGGRRPSSNQIGLEVLKGIDDLENRIPSLGSLSFLANYWSYARGAPSPTSDLKVMSCALRHLKKIEKEIDNICELTETIPVASHITSKVLACTEGYIPALEEDMMFTCLQFCHDLKLFQNTIFQEVPLPSIFENGSSNKISNALRSTESRTYEKLVAEPAKRHLDAFGQKCLQELGHLDIIPPKESMSILVPLVLRKYRISELIHGLERVGGGTLLSMMCAKQVLESDSEKSPYGLAFDVDPPLPRQQEYDFEIESPEAINTKEMQKALKKKRRLFGSCTPGLMDTGGSTPASYDEDPGNLRVRRRLTLDEPRNDLHASTRKSPEAPIEPKRKKRRIDEDDEIEPIREKRNIMLDSQKYRNRQVLTNTIGPERSLRIRLTQSQERRNEPKRPRWTDENRRSEISKIIRNVFYPPDEVKVTPPRNLKTKTFWRETPSEEYVQNFLQSASVSSSQ